VLRTQLAKQEVDYGLIGFATVQKKKVATKGSES